MYNVSQAFKDAIKGNGREFKATIAIRDNNIFDDNNIIEIELSEDVNPADSFMIGSVASNKIEATLINLPNNLILDGAKIAPKIGLNTGTAYEDVPLGIFWIDEIQKVNNTVKITAFDSMIKLEKAYFSDLNYPASINAVAQEICNKAGVELATVLPNTQINKIEGYTYREAISFIASFLGGFAKFNRDGKLEITSYIDTDTIITADYYVKNPINAQKTFTIGKLSCKVGDSIFSSGSNSNEVQFENPIMTQSQLDSIYNTLKNINYMPFDMEWKGNHALQAGDRINIVDPNGNTYNTLLMQNQISYKGSISGKASAKANTGQKQEFNSNGSIKNTVDRMVVEQANIKYLLAKKASIEELEVNYAHITNGIIDNASINCANIVDLRVDTANIADASIITAKILDGAITNAKIANGSIDNAKIGNAAINTVNIKTGAITNALIGIAAIQTANIASGNITNALIADATVTGAKIANSTIVNALIADATITGAKIASATIDGANIKSATITTANIASATITSANIADAAITNVKILDASITGAKIDSATITNANIANATITGAKIANATIGTANIANGAITNALIGIAAIGSTQIADGSITDAKIVSLTANKISAGTIDASKITVTNLNCANLTVGTINGKQIAPGAITATQLATGAVGTSQLTIDVNNTIQTAYSTANTANSTANTALSTANGKNKAYRQSTTPTNGLIAGDLWFDTGNDNRVSTWNGSSWDLNQFGDAAVSNLDAGTITTGTLNAARIGANTITSDKILIGDFANLIGDDPGFENGGIGWNLGSTSVVITGSGAHTGSKVLYIVGNGSIRDVVNRAIPCQAGDQFYAECWIKTDGATGLTGTVGLQNTLTGSGVSNGYQSFQNISASALSSSWTKLSGIVTIPTGYTSIQVRCTVRNDVPSGNFYFDDVILRRVTPGVLIQDGAITASKITASTITGDKIASGTITASNIAASTITATQIASGTITATQISSGTITGDKLVTGTITADKIASSAITTNQIAANTITGGDIASGTITATNIAAGSITTAQLASTVGSSLDISSNTSITLKADKSYVDSIQIGGRNYALGTATPFTLTNFLGVSNQNVNMYTIKNDVIGKKITISFNYNISNLSLADTQNARMYCQLYYTNNGKQAWWGLPTVTLQNGSYSFTYSLVAPISNVNYTAQLRVDYVSAGIITVSNFKVEIGDKATDWTPAPEDMVDKPNIISSINLSPETIGISASKITISGAVTLNSWSHASDPTKIDGGDIYTNSITANKIATNTITATSGVIANAAITGAMIANATITNANIASATITAAQIANGTITNAKIANATIGTAQISNLAITTALIADGAITTAKIVDASITNAKIANIDAGKITTGTLDAGRISAGSITTDKLASSVGNSLDISSNVSIISKVNAADFGSLITQNQSSVKVAIGQLGGNNLLSDSSFELGDAAVTGRSSALHNAQILSGSIYNLALLSGSNRYLMLDTFGTTGDAYVETNMELGLDVGKTYTLSYYYVAAGSIKNHSSYFYCPTGPVGFGEIYKADQTWHRFSCQYTHQSRGTIKLRFGMVTAGDAWLIIDNIKIEEGVNVTAWSPNQNELKNSCFEVTQQHARFTSSDGSYTEFAPGSTGLKWHKNDGVTTYDYFYLSASGQGSANAALGSVKVNLPQEFYGKDFKVAVSLKSVSIDVNSVLTDIGAYVGLIDKWGPSFSVGVAALAYEISYIDVTKSLLFVPVYGKSVDFTWSVTC